MGLAKIGKPAIEPLIALLNESNEDMRWRAVWVLGMIKDESVVEPLIGVLKDRNQDVRKEAIKALTKITGQNFGQDIEKWQQWWEENK